MKVFSVGISGLLQEPSVGEVFSLSFLNSQDGSLENDKTIQLCPERVSFFQFTSENELRCN